MWRQRRKPEGSQLNVLTTLVEAHEEKHFLMEMPDPIEAIRFGLELQRFRPLVLTT